MIEQEPHIILPKKDKIRVLPRCDLRNEKNGIDRISTPTKRTGLIYEDYCFNELIKIFPQDFIIGPRLIDYMGDVCHSSLFNSTGRTRPDALVLSNYLSTTFISAIVECKSGNEPELKPKANGFQDLAKAVEESPGEIYKGFKMSIGEEADNLPIYPKNIRILEDKLRVIFMTNYEVDKLDDAYSRLELDYSTFPLPLSLK
jgi:hypothetical protein